MLDFCCVQCCAIIHPTRRAVSNSMDLASQDPPRIVRQLSACSLGYSCQPPLQRRSQLAPLRPNVGLPEVFPPPAVLDQHRDGVERQRDGHDDGDHGV